MKMLYGTLGWHVDYLEPAIRKVENLDAVVIYYGYIEKDIEKKKTLETLEKMKSTCEQIGLKVYDRQLKDIYDFTGIVKRIKKDLEDDENRGHNIAMFSIGGGSKPTCSAALMVCIFKGIPAIYVNESTKEVVQIPLLETKYLDALTKKEKEVTMYILEHKAERMTQAELANIFRKKRATLNQQIQSLVNKGVLIFENGKDGRTKVVRPSEGIELLFE